MWKNAITYIVIFYRSLFSYFFFLDGLIFRYCLGLERGERRKKWTKPPTNKNSKQKQPPSKWKTNQKTTQQSNLNYSVCLPWLFTAACLIDWTISAAEYRFRSADQVQVKTWSLNYLSFWRPKDVCSHSFCSFACRSHTKYLTSVWLM